MLAFSYLCLLVIVTVFIIYLQDISKKRCPIKIRRFYFITFTLLLVRYAALILGMIVEKQIVGYYIKNILMLNIVAIPLLTIVAFYIFYRDEQRTFDYNYIFLGLLLIAYGLLMVLYKPNVEMSGFGFIVQVNNFSFIYLIYLIMLSSVAVLSLIFIDKPYGNKQGMIMLMMASMFAVAEYILYSGGIKVFPYPLFGEVLILLTTYKAIRTFKIVK